MSKLQKLERIDIILIIIVLVLVVINLVIYVVEIGQPKYMLQQINTQISTTTTTTKKTKEPELIEVPQTDEELIKHLSTLKERDRIEYYCGVYFKHLEKKEYEKAYNLLYSEFKQNYFPTLEEYEAYIKNTYPTTWALEYDDITRQGYIYVLKLKILDILGSKENEKSQRIVVKENNYNDFVISFQVIENEEKFGDVP